MGGRKEKLLLADNGLGRGRILIFGREPWLKYLVFSSWYINVTTPKLFYQVFAILAKKYAGVHSICYALLPNKENTTYVKMFEMLVCLVPNLTPIIIILILSKQ